MILRSVVGALESGWRGSRWGVSIWLTAVNDRGVRNDGQVVQIHGSGKSYRKSGRLQVQQSEGSTPPPALKMRSHVLMRGSSRP